ncbi:B-cell receptor CD22-like [Xyrauchen texanus]|uniref:B-cell receptor CD22-like n=1 Tax=Xyrauchen texanus TaxID=154827 RepID=UPI002242C601|nr:B-cell receptor CD22-like [Xyrauchen texanus]
MSGRMAPHLPLIFLLIIPGVYSDGWGVSYSSSYICAIKGSSVIMPCTYTYPSGNQVMNVFWTDDSGSYPQDLSIDPEYSQRIQYLGDNLHNCTLRLNNVTQKDKRMYYFRFITDKDRWTGKSGVNLDVTDLRVESPENVTEGDTVNLTCKSTCNVNNKATFIWWKNTQSLTEMNNKLLLQSVRREDAGRYSCAVHGYNLTSPPVYLNVMYPPKNTVISISGSVEIYLGDSVNLTCISDSNPPVVNYTWFKENESSSVGSGQNYSTLQSGFFYCVAQNQLGSQRSAAVSVTVHHGSSWHVVLGITVGCGVFIVIIIIIVIILFKTRKSSSTKPEDLTVKQDDLYSNITGEVQTYANVSHKWKTESRDMEEIQYAMVQHHKHKEMKRPEENENQFDNVRIHHSDAAMRQSNLQTMEDLSVIYSSVKKPV